MFRVGRKSGSQKEENIAEKTLIGEGVRQRKAKVAEGYSKIFALLEI